MAIPQDLLDLLSSRKSSGFTGLAGNYNNLPVYIDREPELYQPWDYTKPTIVPQEPGEEYYTYESNLPIDQRLYYHKVKPHDRTWVESSMSGLTDAISKTGSSVSGFLQPIMHKVVPAAIIGGAGAVFNGVGSAIVGPIGGALSSGLYSGLINTASQSQNNSINWGNVLGSAVGGAAASGLLSGVTDMLGGSSAGVDPSQSWSQVSGYEPLKYGSDAYLTEAAKWGGGASGLPLVYGSDAMVKAGAELGMSPEETLSLWDDSLGGTSTWGDYLKGTSKEVAKKQLLDILKKTPSLLSGGVKLDPIKIPSLMTAPKYSATGNTWSESAFTPEQAEQNMTPEEKNKKLAQLLQDEKDKRQAYLKNYIANIPPKASVISEYLA